MSAGRPVRIAVLGAGQIGRQHIQRILAEPMAALHAVVDPSEAGGEAARGSGVAWFPDFEALMRAGSPDALLIATPNKLHVEQGLAAVAAGLPALVEKPIADDIAEATRLVEAAERAGVPLLVGHHRRHNPLIARAREVIASGRLGRLVAVHGFFWLLKPDDYFDVPWRRRIGAGPRLMNMIHDIDLLRHLCGEIAAVQAFEDRSIRGNEVDETTVVSLRFAGGALGTLTISDTVVAPWSWEQSSGENAAYPLAGENCYFIAGVRGSLAIPRLDLWSNEGRQGWMEPFRCERLVAPRQDPLALQIAHFCKVARGEEQPLVSGREGLMTLRAVAAIARAAASGEIARP